MHSTRHSLFALGSAALLGATLGACFTGSQAEGLPCTANSHCGPTLECIDGFCGGVIVCGDGSTVAAALACDGTLDCEGGHDEDPALCGTDAFFCDDESTVPLAATCDGMADCPDGSDEAASICVFDQCNDPSELFEFFDGPGTDGIDEALGVFPGQFIGDDKTDMVFAQRGGMFVRLLEFTPGMPPLETELPGENGEEDNFPNFPSGVQDVIPYDFDSDGDTDLMVVTNNAKFFGYISDPPNPPTRLALAGGLLDYFELPDTTIADVALGRVNQGAFVDVVILTNDGTLLTALGNADSAALGQIPFDLPFEMQTIEGSAFTQVLLADISDDGVDELLIVGAAAMPQLWVLRRNGAMWDVSQQPIPIAATEVAVGDFNAAPGRDIALIERMQGRVVTFSPVDLGMLMPNGTPLELGTDINGLAVRDIDCDGTDDLIFNVESPPAIQVLFSNDMAELSLTRSLTIESAGRPQGNLALVQFDPDGSWDMFHAVSSTSQLEGPEIRSFVSFDPAGGAP